MILCVYKKCHDIIQCPQPLNQFWPCPVSSFVHGVDVQFPPASPSSSKVFDVLNQLNQSSEMTMGSFSGLTFTGWWIRVPSSIQHLNVRAFTYKLPTWNRAGALAVFSVLNACLSCLTKTVFHQRASAVGTLQNWNDYSNEPKPTNLMCPEEG